MFISLNTTLPQNWQYIESSPQTLQSFTRFLYTDTLHATQKSDTAITLSQQRGKYLKAHH